jgi:hypothetical protein
MDKLELDERVARLERRLGQLWTGILFVGILIGAGLFFLLFSQVGRSVKAPGLVTGPPGSVAALENRLTTLDELRTRGDITPADRDAAKAKLLAEPLSASDLKTDMARVQHLRTRNLISIEEADRVKAKLLEIKE